jgi:hypothetical protein
MGKPFTGSVTGVYLNQKNQGSGQGLQRLKSGATMSVVSIFERCIKQPWALRRFLRWVPTGLEDNHETWFDSRVAPF